MYSMAHCLLIDDCVYIFVVVFTVYTVYQNRTGGTHLKITMVKLRREVFNLNF